MYPAIRLLDVLDHIAAGGARGRPTPWWLSRGDTAALARFGAQTARTARAPATPRAALRARLLGETSVAFPDLE